MCIAVVTTPGHALTERALDNGWRINNDGAGFAYVANGHVEIRKGFMKLDPFKDAYFKAVSDYGATSPFLVHMRIGTSGGNTPNNTHPFRIAPQRGPAGAMIHNGVLFYPHGALAGPANDRRSDTRVVSQALNNILTLEDIKRGKEALGKAIRSSNKLAFLYDNGEYVIINEAEGFWKDGIWYSNSTCGVTRGA